MSNESSSARCSSYWKVWRYSTGKTWLWFIQDAAKSAIGVFLWSWSHELSCFPSNLVAILTISETASFVRCLDRGPVPHQAALITPTIPALGVLLSAEMQRVGRDAHIMWFVFKAPQRWVAPLCYDSQYSGHYGNYPRDELHIENITWDYSLKRRLSECSRRFHNHGEGPY